MSALSILLGTGLWRPALKLVLGTVALVVLLIFLFVSEVASLFGPLLQTGGSPEGTVIARVGSIPPEQLAVMQEAAESSCGLPWQVLAGIARVESDFGRDMGVSSAGATGYGQFLPSTGARFGSDANHDGYADPYDYHDAIPAMARYLCAFGATEDMPKAVYAYNRADWYVSEVLTLAASYGYAVEGGTGTSRAAASVCPPRLRIVPSALNTTLPSGARGLAYRSLHAQYPANFGFGPSRLLGEPSAYGYAHFHLGVDLDTPYGTPLYAPAPGLAYADATGRYGWGNGPNRAVILSLRNGSSVHYYHLSRLAVYFARPVREGELLGYTGDSGYSTGPHLHIEVHGRKGEIVPPEQWECSLRKGEGR